MAGAKIDEPGQATAEDRERLKALGYVGSQVAVGTQPGVDSMPDPKDKVIVLEQYRRALELVRQQRTEEAVAAFRSMLAENPGMADGWSEIGGLLLRLGRTGEAIAAYKRLVEVAPHDPSALVTVAQLLVQAGRLDEAQAQATAAVDILANAEGRWKAAAHKVLMRVALERKNPQLARAEAARAQQADPSIPLPDFVEGLIRYDAGQFEDALPYFQKAVRREREPDIPGAGPALLPGRHARDAWSATRRPNASCRSRSACSRRVSGRAPPGRCSIARWGGWRSATRRSRTSCGRRRDPKGMVSPSSCTRCSARPEKAQAARARAARAGAAGRPPQPPAGR